MTNFKCDICSESYCTCKTCNKKITCNRVGSPLNNSSICGYVACSYYEDWISKMIGKRL